MNPLDDMEAKLDQLNSRTKGFSMALALWVLGDTETVVLKESLEANAQEPREHGHGPRYVHTDTVHL